MRVLVTCPPMIGRIDHYAELFKKNNITVHCPEFTQVMTEEELMKILPEYDGWIIGDDPATRRVFEAGHKGRLRVAVKWGVGVDNVDFKACDDLGIPITNTPGMFGEEVSDIAIGYLICLNRKIHQIHYNNMKGEWTKPCGVSLVGKKVCLVGFGDIGRCTARKLLAFRLNVSVSDPGFEQMEDEIVCRYSPDIKVDKELNRVKLTTLDDAMDGADYVIVTCALNKQTFHLINYTNLSRCNKGVKVINVSRGSVVKEDDIVALQKTGYVDSVAFDVLEEEPLTKDNRLKRFPNNMFGSHNGSNTVDAVDKTSRLAINKLINRCTC